jgi:hypothetical protein
MSEDMDPPITIPDGIGAIESSVKGVKGKILTSGDEYDGFVGLPSTAVNM